MKRKAWFHYYLLLMGSTLLTLGLIVLARNLIEHRIGPGLLLGAALVIYGLLRIRQRRKYPLQDP